MYFIFKVIEKIKENKIFRIMFITSIIIIGFIATYALSTGVNPFVYFNY